MHNLILIIWFIFQLQGGSAQASKCKKTFEDLSSPAEKASREHLLAKSKLSEKKWAKGIELWEELRNRVENRDWDSSLSERLRPFFLQASPTPEQYKRARVRLSTQAKMLTQVLAYDQQLALGYDRAQGQFSAKFRLADRQKHSEKRNLRVVRRMLELATDTRIPAPYRDFLKEYVDDISSRDLPPHNRSEEYLFSLEKEFTRPL